MQPDELAMRLLHTTDWEIDYLLSLGAKSWWVHAVVVVLTAQTLDMANDGVAEWLAAMLLATAAMLLLCMRGAASPRRQAYGWAHTVATALVGLLWAAGAWLAMGLSDENLLVYTLALGGTALGAVSSQHSVMRSCLVSIWTSCSGLAAAHAFSGMSGNLANGLMVLMFAVALSMLMFRMHRFIVANHDQAEALRERVAELETERARANHANELKSRFMAYVSHDLRQPVHAMGLQVDILKCLPLDREVTDIVHKVDQSVRSLGQLFQSLLTMSALELGQVKSRPTSVDLRQLLRRIATQNELAAEQTGNSLRLLSGPCHVCADGALLANIVQNLVSNALAHAPASRITLGVRRRSGGLSVVVTDRGPGIPAHVREKLFEDFYQVGKETSTLRKGNGLGLPLVRRFCDLLGLGIELRSWPGRGTLLEISGLTPCAPESGVRKEPEAAAAGHRGSRLAGLRVVLVEDDAETLEATRRLIEQWGCAVQAFAAPPAKLPTADLLVTDYALGGGHTALTLIEQATRQISPRLPILVLTGLEAPDLTPVAPEVDIRLMAKPARPAQLRAMLTTMSYDPSPYGDQ